MWHAGTIEGFWWQAKVYDEGSKYGIDGGRVSKLLICRGTKLAWSQQIYNYDRGLDFDDCPPHILAAILAHCEARPKEQSTTE